MGCGSRWFSDSCFVRGLSGVWSVHRAPKQGPASRHIEVAGGARLHDRVQFVGGNDIIMELYETGELLKMLKELMPE